MNIRTNLANARKQYSYTQKSIAKELSMSERNYRNIELGKRGTSELNWLKLYYTFREAIPLHKLMEKTHIPKDQ